MIKSIFIGLCFFTFSAHAAESDLSQNCSEKLAAEAISSTVSFMVEESSQKTATGRPAGISLIDKFMKASQAVRIASGPIDHSTGESVDAFQTTVTVVVNSDPDNAAAVRYNVTTLADFNAANGTCDIYKTDIEYEN